jgi:hypothetical protein
MWREPSRAEAVFEQLRVRSNSQVLLLSLMLLSGMTTDALSQQPKAAKAESFSGDQSDAVDPENKIGLPLIRHFAVDQK